MATHFPERGSICILSKFPQAPLTSRVITQRITRQRSWASSAGVLWPRRASPLACTTKNCAWPTSICHWAEVYPWRRHLGLL